MSGGHPVLGRKENSEDTAAGAQEGDRGMGDHAEARRARPREWLSWPRVGSWVLVGLAAPATIRSGHLSLRVSSA